MNKDKLLGEIERYWRDQLADAGEDSVRRQEIERQLVQVRFLPKRDHRDPEDIIVPSCLIELETGNVERSVRSWCYLIPSGGGLVLSVDGKPVQVVTPQSPLGAALLGRSRGDQVEIPLGAGKRTMRIADFF